MVSITTPGLLEAIQAKLIQPRPDCQIWPGAVDRGYGRVFIDGKAQRVHRVVWELVNGPIPDGLTIDHLCRVRSCVNTEHMELVTADENKRRAEPFRMASVLDVKPVRSGVRRVPMTHCFKGHEFTAENTLTRPNGARRCRTCSNERDRNRRRST